MVAVAGERIAGIGGSTERLLPFAQHGIGPYQAKPSVDVRAVFSHALSKTSDHALDHSIALGWRHLRGSRNIARLRPGRCNICRAGWRAGGSGRSAARDIFGFERQKTLVQTLQ